MTAMGRTLIRGGARTATSRRAVVLFGRLRNQAVTRLLHRFGEGDALSLVAMVLRSEGRLQRHANGKTGTAASYRPAARSR